MLNDLRYTLRTLLKSPGLAGIAILSLGLGIGLNLTVFGIFESMFIRGVTAADPEHTFHVWVGGSNRASYPNLQDLRRSGAVKWLVGYTAMQFSVGDGERREKIYGQPVAGDYFEMLGVQPSLGRGFTAEEKIAERDTRVVILSYPFWKQRFHGDRAALGETLRLNGQPFTIVGVLPEAYRSIHGFAMEPPFYVPYSGAVDPAYKDRTQHPLELAMRIAPGQTREQATASILAAANELERVYPNENRKFGQVQVYGISVFDQLNRQGGATKILVFFGILGMVVGLILLIACANVAGLLVARAVNRRREVAIRLAIGGTRARLVRLFLAEGLILSVAGLGAASLIYVWGVQLVERVRLPVEVPFYLHPELNWRMALYSAAIAIGAALLCSFAPALEASRANVSAALKNELEAAGRGRTFSLRNNLVIGQVAVSMLLLVVSLLFVRSLRDVQTVDPGFNVQNQILATVRPDQSETRSVSKEDLTDGLTERLAKMAGVRSVTDAFIVPLSHNSWITGLRIGNDAHKQPLVQANAVGSNYFTTMGVRIVAGREFDPRDTKTSTAVAVVNQTFAKQFFAGASPLGQVLTAPGKGIEREPWEIVGVVADSKHESLGEGPTPVVYRPLKQEGIRFNPTIHVRTEQPATAMVPTVRAALRAAYPNALVEVKTMEENIELSTMPNKIGAALLGTMGALGLVLASIGLYGVLAYAVSRRAREIGVRMALGASPVQVLRIVLGQAMVLVGVGVAVGLTLSLLATRPLATFLSAGVSVTDPSTLAAVVGVLGVTALAAAFVPAMRALRVDPIQALRCD